MAVLEPRKTIRNVAIILAIAAAVDFIPGSSRATSTLEAVLWVGFGVAIGYLGLRLYREHRVSLYGLGERHRALLYASAAILVFALEARSRMWQTGFGELGWFALIALVVYGFMEVFRHSRSY